MPHDTDVLAPAALAQPQRAWRPLTSLPGPSALPLIGHAHHLKAEVMHQQLEQWALVHGPLYQFRIGPVQGLVVADHALVTAILKDRPGAFRRGAKMTEILLETGMKPGVFHAEGQAWQNQRRMVMSGFSPANVRAYFPSLLRVTQRLQGRWARAAATGQTIELLPDLMRFTVDVVSGLAFGNDTNTLEGGEDIIQHHLDKVFPAAYRRLTSVVPYWRYFKLPVDRELDRSLALIDTAIEGFIAQARECLRLDPGLRQQPGNLLQAMILAADQGGSGVNDDDVAGNVLAMLLAGEDTTAATIAWAMHLLHRHPPALRRAQAEVRAHLTELAGWSPEQLSALPYLEACLNETMRLKPVAPFSPLEPLHDTVIGDVQVPAGTLVWCLMRHDSLSADHVADPLSFKPERWLDDGHGPGAAQSVKRVSMPFGAGPRVCPGRYLAMLEMKMAVAMLLTQFDIDRVDTPDGQPAKERMAFTMSPVGLSMTLSDRQTAGRA